ncbi:thioredoxin family protein [Staphylococcus sp. 11261D007BR]
MVHQLSSLSEFKTLIHTHPLVIIQVSRQSCSVCHAVLPRMEALVQQYPEVKMGVIDAEAIPEIVGELSIFTVPVDIIFFEGKEMHREGRFIDFQQFESQLHKIYESIYG